MVVRINYSIAQKNDTYGEGGVQGTAESSADDGPNPDPPGCFFHRFGSEPAAGTVRDQNEIAALPCEIQRPIELASRHTSGERSEFTPLGGDENHTSYVRVPRCHQATYPFVWNQSAAFLKAASAGPGR